MTDKVQVNLRLKPEIIEQLKVEAEAQSRSLNNMLEVIIKEYLDNKKV